MTDLCHIISKREREREKINEINFEKDLYPEYNAHFPTSAKSMEIIVSYGKLEKRYIRYIIAVNNKR